MTIHRSVDLYLTTDAWEAAELLEDPNGYEYTHHYHDIDILHGQSLQSRVGFNPMCSVEMNGASKRDLDAVTKKLTSEGLYVAIEIDGKIQKYFPADDEIRTQMIKSALIKSQSPSFHDRLASRNLILYSNGLTLARPPLMVTQPELEFQ